MQKFVSIFSEVLNAAADDVDLEATRTAAESDMRPRACQRVIFTTSIEHKNDALPKIKVPITGLNKILDVEVISFVKNDGAYLDRALITKEPTIDGTTVIFEAAGAIPVGTDLKFDVIGTN